MIALSRWDFNVEARSVSWSGMVELESVSVDCLGLDGSVEIPEAVGGAFCIFDVEGSFPFRFHFG